MSEDIFADKLIDISVTGALVRLDFCNLAQIDKDHPEQARFVLSRRLVMPIEGFLEMGDALNKMIAVMIEKGTIVRREGTASN